MTILIERRPDQEEHEPVAVPAARLPRYTRVRPAFEERFARSARETIAAMDRAGDDIPSQAPRIRVALQRVGLSRTAIPVTIQDPFDARNRVQIACSVTAHASLAAGRRGMHVSRTGNLLARLSEEVFPSLQHYAAALCAQVCDVQQSDSAGVTVDGVLSYVEEAIGITGRASIEHVGLHAAARRTGGVQVLTTGVGFNHITACPCVQQTFKHSFDDRQADLLAIVAERAVPFLSHSQRCRSEVRLAGVTAPIPLGAWLACVDRIVVRCQNTLPRDSELLAVHRAHADPQFLEDVLRDLLEAIYELVHVDHPQCAITIDAASMESIHDFDLSGTITSTIAELHDLKARSSRVA